MRVKTLNMELPEIQSHFSEDIPKEWLERIDEACRPHYIWLLRAVRPIAITAEASFPPAVLRKRCITKEIPALAVPKTLSSEKHGLARTPPKEMHCHTTLPNPKLIPTS